MKNPKIFFSVFVIVIGAVGAYFIINNSMPVTNFPGNSDNNQKTDTNPISENNVFQVQQPINNKTNNNANLTDKFEQSLLNNIKNGNLLVNNTAGPIPQNILASDQSMSDLLGSSKADLNFIDSISDSEIIISNDNSVAAKKKYLETITEANKKDVGSFNKNYIGVIIDTFQKTDTTSAAKLADIFKNTVADYEKISVPSDWADIHKEQIVYLKNSETLYSAMSQYTTDPIKGYFALDMVDGLVQKAGEIKNILIQKANEVKG